MASFGKYGPMPLRFGGGVRPIEALHRSLQQQLEPYLDVQDEDGIPYVETYAEASVLAQGWVANGRLRGQLQPTKMIENLPVWEEATRLRVTQDARDIDRRRALAGKMRGLGENTVSDIRDACAALLGAQFVELHTTDAADEVTYWPGVNPGPPGLEWCSNRATVRVELTKAGITQQDFERLTSELVAMLDDLCPSWMNHGWFVSSSAGGFIIGQSLLGETGL